MRTSCCHNEDGTCCSYRERRRSRDDEEGPPMYFACSPLLLGDHHTSAIPPEGPLFRCFWVLWVICDLFSSNTHPSSWQVNLDNRFSSSPFQLLFLNLSKVLDRLTVFHLLNSWLLPLHPTPIQALPWPLAVSQPSPIGIEVVIPGPFSCYQQHEIIEWNDINHLVTTVIIE